MKGYIGIFFVLVMLGVSGCHPNTDIPAHCTNHVQDGNETGVDCGGDCPSCGNTSNYYFSFDLAGTTYSYSSSIIQYNTNGANEVGGFVPQGTNLYANGGILFDLSDSATAARINHLVNDTVFFDSGALPSVEIEHSPNSSTQNTSDYTSDHKYFALVSSVTYLRRDSVLFDLDIYAIKGTFRARMTDFNGDYIGDATNGKFFLQCSAQHFN